MGSGSSVSEGRGLNQIMSKGDEIERFNKKSLILLSERCLRECGKAVSLLHFPVFRRFVNERLKRDLTYYRLCLDFAIELQETGLKASEDDIEGILKEAVEIDRRFLRAISYLPLKLTIDYKEINRFRKERTVLLLGLYLNLLRVGYEDASYKEMVKGAYKKKDFIELNDSLLDLYAEEIFIINSSLKAMVPIGDIEAIAHRLFCTMQDMGRRLNREIADEIYG